MCLIKVIKASIISLCLALCFVYTNCFNAKAQYGGLGLDINKFAEEIKKKELEEKYRIQREKLELKYKFAETSEYELIRSVCFSLDLINIVSLSPIQSISIGGISTLLSQSVNIVQIDNKVLLSSISNWDIDISVFNPALNTLSKFDKILIDINNWSSRLLALWDTSGYYLFYNAKRSLERLNDYGYTKMTMRNYEYIIKGIILSPKIYQMK